MTTKDLVFGELQRNTTGVMLIGVGVWLYLHGTAINQQGIVKLGDGFCSAGLYALKSAPPLAPPPPANTTVETKSVTVPPPETPPTPTL